MIIMAIDSSGLVASVAILRFADKSEMLAEYTINYKKTHSQTLVPMLDEVKRMLDFDLKEVDAIAVAAGPGSFTGLRIGSATAKGLGFVLDKPIISVPTVDALAYNLCETNKLVCPIMDARRNQVYTGLYTFEKQNMIVVTEQCVVMIDEIAAKINQLGKEVVFLGDGVPVFAEKMSELIKVPYSFAPAHMSRQRAGALGVLAYEYYKAGKIQTAAEHKPNYLRESQAERELAEKNAKKQFEEQE
jgi:tRNA threonylcarbamoyladenosine biosynthesis protein TsaB